MTNRNYFFFFGLTILLIPLFGANPITGPSWIESEIKPIAINENGEVLCKTRFSKNEMGAHMAMNVTYGFCIVSTDSIIQYDAKILDPFKIGEDSFYNHLNYWDSVFEAKVTAKALDEIKSEVLKNAHNFSTCNTDSFKVDKVFPISAFEKNRNVNLSKIKQKGLYGAESADYYEDLKIHLLYDFGSILFLHNEIDMDLENVVGADFNYLNPWTDENGIERNIGFELSKVTGILIVE